MPHFLANPMRVLAWLIVAACSAHADEATDTADPSELTAGATLMTDYIYRGIRPPHVPLGVGKHYNACLSLENMAFSPMRCMQQRARGSSLMLP